jgi:pimeloyl-ACP methyl ester carboxylesterase
LLYADVSCGRIEAPVENPLATSLTELRPQFLSVGAPPTIRRIAVLKRAATHSALPGLVWLGGFKSDMRGTKANFLDAEAARAGRAFLRFDYSGHGESEGRFEAGTISAWLEESLAVIRQESQGPQILIGSSMGGWLALLCARALATSGETERLAGLVLIAPAADMTERLIWDQLTPEQRQEIATKGRCLLPAAYGGEPIAITRALIENGREHLLLEATIRTHCPVHILQGMNDAEVPWSHATRLVEHLAGDPVTLTLAKEAEHRFSRPADLALLARAIETLVETPAQGELDFG